MKRAEQLKPVKILQNTFSDRAPCIAQLRPGSSFLRSALRFFDRKVMAEEDKAGSGGMAAAKKGTGKQKERKAAAPIEPEDREPIDLEKELEAIVGLARWDWRRDVFAPIRILHLPVFPKARH